MRDELAGLIDYVEGEAPAPGLLDAPDAVLERKRPPLADRAKAWALAVTLIRELGTEVDPPQPDQGDAPAAGTRRRARRVDFG